jgi:hypothetical protein
MDRQSELYYHLQLAHDLILCMMKLQTDGLSTEQKVIRTTMILESWAKRMETKIKELNLKTIQDMSKLPNADDLDVLKILSGVHQMETEATRENFKNIVKDNVIKSYKVK